MYSSHDVVEESGWHNDAQQVAIFIHVAQETTFYDKSILDVEIL